MKAIVGSYKNPGRTYQVDMGRLHCECKRPEISGHPCAHIFAVGLKGGKDPYKYMNTADTMHGYRKQYCDAVRLSPPETGADEDASACSELLEWQSFVGIDIFGVAGGTPTGCDGHGLQMFRDIATDKLELKVREYPVAPSMTRLLEMHSAGKGVFSNLALPPVVRQSRGRPPSTKRKLGVLERGGTPRKRQTPTCSNCQQRGHRRNKCPNMARAPLQYSPHSPLHSAVALPPVGAPGASGGSPSAL
jgi:hypothetical protein